MNPALAASWLRERAASYSRDAYALQTEGDQAMASAYETIAAELRVCADRLDPANRTQLELGV